VNSLHACALAQPSRATGLGQLPGRAGWAQPSPKKNKKKIESVEIKILHVLEKMYSCQFIH